MNRPVSGSQLQDIADGKDPAFIDDRMTVAALAGLDPINYDRVRKTAADRLGIRVDTLDREVHRARGGEGDTAAAGGRDVDLPTPEPWPTPVNGEEMLNTIAATLVAHVIMASVAADAMALWIVHAHAHDAAAISPILAITSPTPECGKSTALDALSTLTPRALPAANITSAAGVEKWAPTLMIDEADTFLAESDELRGVLNSGHSRASAWVIRTVGEDHDPRRFKTWAPKAIAAIGKLPATLVSRAITVELRRLGDGELVLPLRRAARSNLEKLARHAARWAQDHVVALADSEPDMPATLRGRAADNWRALLAIADQVGGEWPKRSRKAAEALSGRRSEETVGVVLLGDLRALFAARKVDRLTSAEIVTALGRIEDRPWPEWEKSGKPLTVRQLARLLEPFGIGPKTIRTDTERLKGYYREAFADAFRRYLPSNRATVTMAENRDSDGLSSVTAADRVTDDDAVETAENRDCHGGTDETPVPTAGGIADLSDDDARFIAEELGR